MSVARMVDLLDCAYEARDQIVPCLIGPVGIGKTAAVSIHAEHVREKYGVEANITKIIASQILPNEVSGITMPDPKSKSMEIYDHYRMSHMKDGDILFFDELFEADQYVLSACLTLIEDRMMMSGNKLPDVQIIAATNPTISASSIKPSIRQRFMFSEFRIDLKDTREYLENRFNVKVPLRLLEMISPEGDSTQYNFLTPRSLTKLIQWMLTAKTIDEAKKIEFYVSDMWSNLVSSCLITMWHASRLTNNDERVKSTLINKFSLDEMRDCSLEEIVLKLNELGDWEEAARFLATQELDPCDNETMR